MLHRGVYAFTGFNLIVIYSDKPRTQQQWKLPSKVRNLDMPLFDFQARVKAYLGGMIISTYSVATATGSMWRANNLHAGGRIPREQNNNTATAFLQQPDLCTARHPWTMAEGYCDQGLMAVGAATRLSIHMWQTWMDADEASA